MTVPIRSTVGDMDDVRRAFEALERNRSEVDSTISTSIVALQARVTALETLGVTIVNDSNYTATSANKIVVFDNLTAARTLTLPAVATMTGKILHVSNGETPTHDVNCTTASGEFYGYSGGATSTTYVAQERNSVILTSDGSNWWVLSDNQSVQAHAVLS